MQYAIELDRVIDGGNIVLCYVKIARNLQVNQLMEEKKRLRKIWGKKEELCTLADKDNDRLLEEWNFIEKEANQRGQLLREVFEKGHEYCNKLSKC